ncbi:MAG: energy transducer TonB [Henriciella sp.]|uniref:hypothetical protein n=1 Tax=Henriciella sp. TaxID=1968823 RepID=UPI003C7236A4
MKLPLIPILFAASTTLAGTAAADTDYHGFKAETVEALNERLETPLTGETLAILSQHTGIEACGGSQAVAQTPPDGWAARAETANRPGGDVVMPVPTSDLAPEYPPLYEVLGVEGVCEVMFDVTAEGQTANIMTNCTLPSFAESTAAVLDALEFETAEGQDSPQTANILLPVNYCRPDAE